MKITDFKKGDLIIKINPSEEPSSLFSPATKRDYSFTENPIIFLGILNGNFYYKYPKEYFMFKIIGDKICYSNLFRHLDDNWKYWQDPKILLDDNYTPPIKEISLKELDKKLEEAINNENYEEADNIKKQIEILKNNSSF